MSNRTGDRQAKVQAAAPQEKPQHVTNVDVSKERKEDENGFRVAGGSPYSSVNNALVRQALGALWLQPGQKERYDKQYNAALCAMMEFKPADGIEGMMAVQAVGLHSATMECLRRAMIPEQSGDAADKLRRQAANLSRTFLDVLAALDRKRGKSGTQVFRVERVQVAAGGQAIVGPVQASGSRVGQHGVGGEYESGTERKPHAPADNRTVAPPSPARLAHDAAPGTVLPPLRGADPERDAVPVPCHAKRPVPDARRGQHRA